MKTAILAIAMFCIMIFPHELGHFIAAKKFGVKVNEFAFGMGPALWKKQGAETLYSIRLFPIGGYCAMEGEDEETDEPRAFTNKKPWERIIILMAGSFMNLVCAIVIMSAILGIGGMTTTTLAEIVPDSPAAVAGIEAGDVVTAVDGVEMDTWSQVTSAIASKGDNEFSVTVERDGEAMDFELTPVVDEDGYSKIGVSCKASHNPITALKEGCKSIWRMTVMMFDTIAMLVSGEVGTENLSGPVGMVQMVNETSSQSFIYFGILTSLICVNLAVVNMLPLPALDGGRIIFAFIEIIMGRSVNKNLEGTIHLVGMLLLFGLMIYATMNDVTRIFG